MRTDFFSSLKVSFCIAGMPTNTLSLKNDTFLYRLTLSVLCRLNKSHAQLPSSQISLINGATPMPRCRSMRSNCHFSNNGWLANHKGGRLFQGLEDGPGGGRRGVGLAKTVREKLLFSEAWTAPTRCLMVE